MHSKEQIERMKPASLRLVVETELNSAFYRGYEHDEADTKARANKLRDLYDGKQLLLDFVKLLQNYPDIEVTETKNGFLLSGTPKKQSRHVETIRNLEFHYYEEDAYVRIVEDEDYETNCSQLDLFWNLTNCSIFQILLWIQDDEALKKCYLEFLDLFQPYQMMLVEQKDAFLTTLTTGIREAITDIPKGQVAAMPITLNIPLFLYRLKEELDSYQLADSEAPVHHDMVDLAYGKVGERFAISLDTSTMNGVLFYMKGKGRLDMELLNAEQLKYLIKCLVPKLKRGDNFYGKLFAEKMVDTLYELVYWEENETVKDENEKFELLFG